MLPVVPCGDLEANWRVVTWTNFWWWKWENLFAAKKLGDRHYLINTWLEKDGMLPNYALVWPWSLSKGSGRDKLFLVKMGKNVESQGHIFTFDLIFSGSVCHTEGSCVLWTVFCSVYMCIWKSLWHHKMIKIWPVEPG